VHLALEELLPNNGIDDDHEEDQQSDVEQGYHGLDDGVQDDLKACTKEKGGEVSQFLNSFGYTLHSCHPSDKQPLKPPMPREEGHRWVGTQISEARNPFSTHHASMQKTSARPGTRQCWRLLHASPFVLLLSP